MVALIIEMTLSAPPKSMSAELTLQWASDTFSGSDGSSFAAGSYNQIAWKLVSVPQKKIDPNIALELAQKANKLNTKKEKIGTYITTLGAAYYRTGPWRESIDVLENKLKQFEGRAEDYLFLAMAYYQANNKDESLKWYSKAVEWIRDNQGDDIFVRDLLFQIQFEAACTIGINLNPKNS